MSWHRLIDIIRVVRIRISNLIRQQYMSAIADVGRQHLSWIDSGVVPELELKAGSYAVDQHSVQATFDLWKAMSDMIEERQSPLPAGRHLLLEVVATWNRGKGPIDVYSRFQKNTKSVHSHLGPVGAIWLRLIMTTVYNAYHSFNLSRAYAFLMSDDCKSFKDFQKMRARQAPFRQFCQQLANDLTIEVASPILYNSSDNDDDNSDSGNDGNGNDRLTTSTDYDIRYKQREAYFSRSDLIARRLNRRIQHLPCSDRKQVSCIWCCRLDHSEDAPNDQKHSRHGRKTTWFCSICEVSLCKVIRYAGKSCFTMFHEADTLFDPCSVAAQEIGISVRSHTNRRAPPSRSARTVASANEALLARNDDEEEGVESNQDEEFIPPDHSSGDDADVQSNRRAIRRRTSTGISVPTRRRTRRRV